MNTTEASTSAWMRDVLGQYEGPLTRYAVRLMSGDVESARDVVQDTFLRLCKADRKRIGDHVAPWLYRVCRNRAIDVLRKERRSMPFTEAHAETQPAQGVAPDVVAARNEEHGRAMAILDTLPPNQQEVVRLKFQNELSYREISDATGLSVSNVGYLIHTAMTTLRQRLAPEAV